MGERKGNVHESWKQEEEYMCQCPSKGELLLNKRGEHMCQHPPKSELSPNQKENSKEKNHKYRKQNNREDNKPKPTGERESNQKWESFQKRE